MEMVRPRSGGVAERSEAWRRSLSARDGLNLGALLWVFAVVMLAFWARRPSLYLHPQFYAEDGEMWYAQAYNLGWLRSLAIPDGGYLNTLQRLIAGMALPFPLALAPSVMNVLGMAVQALPVCVLLSRQTRRWGPFHLRLLMAVLYVVAPNTSEIHVVATNAQWHLALLVALLAFGDEPETRWGWTVNVLALAIASVTGPFCLILLPLVLVLWRARQRRWYLWVAGWMLPGVLLQAHFIFTSQRIMPMPLGASWSLFLRLLGGHVLLDALAGSNYRMIMLPLPVLAAVVLGCLVLIGFSCRRAGLNLLLFALFAFTVFGAGLRTPLIRGPRPLWEMLLTNPGGRYWYFPMVTFLWAAAVAALTTDRPSRWFRLAGRAVLLLMIAGAAREFVYPPLDRHDVAPYAAQFKRLPPGQEERIPVYPDGAFMTLRKH